MKQKIKVGVIGVGHLGEHHVKHFKNIQDSVLVGIFDKNLSRLKEISNKWWQYTVQKMGGALPAAMCKYWGEIMGMAGGHVRRPLSDLSDKEKIDLEKDIREVLKF